MDRRAEQGEGLQGASYGDRDFPGYTTDMSTSATSTEKRKAHPLPVTVYFEGDVVARKALGKSRHYVTVPFSKFDGHRQAREIVVAVSEESLLEENFNLIRMPNLRILGLSEKRFKSARLHEAVYAYVPPQISAELMERTVDNAVDHLDLVLSRHDVYERLITATHEINELNRIGAALSAEHDTEKLLEMILTKCRVFTKADAGSLYMVEQEESAEAGNGARRPKMLRFKLAQNDSVPVPFKEMLLPINETSIAGYVALRGESINLRDSYDIGENVPYQVNRSFDEDSGYRTKSILAVPMRDQKDEIVGVVQLINAKKDARIKLEKSEDFEQYVVAFAPRQQEMLLSLASQAAVAYENSKLYEDIRRLFEGFVKASVVAIEARDPTTSGHSFRVANLTVALARAADRDDKTFREVSFTRDQLREIRYASLLHDFGKVGVREEVLVKARKLYPSQLEMVRHRFDFVRRTIEANVNRQKLNCLLQRGQENFQNEQSKFESEMQQQLHELEIYLEAVEVANMPTVLPEGNFDQLTKIAAWQFMDIDGRMKPLLTGDEVRLLSIRKGSLDEIERREIESHVVHTYNFLKQIPWTREIRHIPQIALGHHEKMNGSGYPSHLSAPEIPLQSRMMTVADIFDALSAADRPYKKAVSRDRALEILEDMVKDGELDGSLFRLFVEARVFDQWHVETAI